MSNVERICRRYLVSKLPGFAVRAAVFIGIGAAVWKYCAYWVGWAERHRHLVGETWAVFFIALAVATGLTACAVVLLTNRDNFERIAINTAIIFGCAVVSFSLADPLNYGSYNHGFGDEDLDQLLSAVMGALVGYGIAVWRGR
jgi:hypothetical protein